MWRRSLWLAALVFLAAWGARAADGPAPEIPELRAFAPLVGTWDVYLAWSPNAKIKKGGSASGVAERRWIDGGRTLRQVSSIVLGKNIPKLVSTTLLTYDPRAKVYRSSVAYENGFKFTSEGTWNEEAGTFMWTTRDKRGGGSGTATSRIVSDGVEDWSLNVKDGSGKVVLELSGRNTRTSN